jgi:precorrin-6Y C5,15-methyltransferase (decarboxylating)
VPKLKRVHGEAPGALADLLPPDAIFVGGNVSDATMLDECMSRLIPGGRLVANAVTLQAENRLQAMCLDHGGELNRIQVSEARAIGRFDVMQPAKAVLQWMWCKPA